MTPDDRAAAEALARARARAEAPLHDPKACRSCGAAIFWARTEAGKAMPVDATPVAGGRVVLLDRGGAVIARVLKQGEAPPPGAKLRQPHHMTCPEGAAWRKSR